MTLPVDPPVAPMLARLVRQLPSGDHLYEPKWDGFRCIAFRDEPTIDLRSRNDRPLARYFPEVVASLEHGVSRRSVVDGEIVVVRDGVADFEALMARLHPAASRAQLLAEQTPATFIAFDVLAVDDTDLRSEPFAQRRAALEDLVETSESLRLTPISHDRDTAAAWLGHAHGGGIDGVIAKRPDLRYEAGKRAMLKVKHERTADCVVAGARLFADPACVASLLLGLYDHAGVLRHVGVASSFAERRRHELLTEVRPYQTDLDGHPWRLGFGTETGRIARLGGAATRWTPDLSLDWLPLRPELVAEVAYDHVELGRFRHPARFRRWRPDRDPVSCRLDQLVTPGALDEILAVRR